MDPELQVVLPQMRLVFLPMRTGFVHPLLTRALEQLKADALWFVVAALCVALAAAVSSTASIAASSGASTGTAATGEANAAAAEYLNLASITLAADPVCRYAAHLALSILMAPVPDSLILVRYYVRSLGDPIGHVLAALGFSVVFWDWAVQDRPNDSASCAAA
ncbi:hypothetical protein FNF28_02014 [Cafeteria roenbergensis]|uniref:Uncharacterized protein n=1 Tax=Cafeteria roenbergensis TaxID=33653 RepID=A0A5A8E0H4_CAFRO|nr:hypothetical protein FNF28_02014 [Cafeteria roenbergensis]